MKHKKSNNFPLKGGKKSVQMDYAKIRKAFVICHSLEHTVNRNILSFFEEKEVFSETEIIEKIRLDADVAQKHLRDLVRIEILTIFHNKNEKCYTVSAERLKTINNFCSAINRKKS